MSMPLHEGDPNPATPRDLVAFHSERARVYHAAATLLRARPAADTLRAAAARLAGGARASDPAQAALRAAVCAAAPGVAAEQFDRLAIEAHRACDRPAEPARAAALAAVGVTGGDRPTELLALAGLEIGIAHALAAGDLGEAASLNDARDRLLRDHGFACLRPFAARLAGLAGAPLYAAVGRALLALLDEDRLDGEAAGG